MEYIVRIEHYQNKRFDYVLSQVPHYMMVLSKMVQCVGMNMKIPFNPEAERMLLSIGLEFTKQSCVVSFLDLNVQVFSENISSDLTNEQQSRELN